KRPIHRPASGRVALRWSCVRCASWLATSWSFHGRWARPCLFPSCLPRRECFGGHDQARKVLSHGENVRIARDQRIRLADMREHQEHLVLLVAADRQVWPWRRQFHHIGVGQKVRQQLLLFRGRQLELGIGQDAQEFTGRLPADQRLQLLVLPGVAYPGQASGTEDQRRQHDVGVEDDPSHHCRAQATASSTSCSVIPSCSSFSRTAWAFWTRTGVRTIRPPSTVTSKYSAASTPDTAALGSVIWF